jgi:hypothetical protein
LARRPAEAPSSQLPPCDLPRLIDHLRTLSDRQLLPVCLERHGAGLITLIELGEEKELTSEGLEALRVIIDELNAWPAHHPPCGEAGRAWRSSPEFPDKHHAP